MMVQLKLEKRDLVLLGKNTKMVDEKIKLIEMQLKDQYEAKN